MRAMLALPCSAANLEINPLLFQTLGKWYAANVDELAALTNVFSLLEFTEVEAGRIRFPEKTSYFLDMSAFLIGCPPLIWKAVQSPAPQIASSSVFAKVISSYFLLETCKRKMDSVQTCSPPTSQKARAGSSVTLSCHKSSSSTPVFFMFFTLSQFIRIYLMVILPVLMHNSVEHKWFMGC